MKKSLRRGLRTYRADSVIVHTRDDQSLRGVLVAVWSDVIVLQHASYVGSSDVLAGELVIPKANLSTVQAGLPA